MTDIKTSQDAITEVSEGKKLGQFFWRSWAIQDSWNYERQMNMGFLYGIAPTIDRCYPDADSDSEQMARKKEAYKRHMAFYNCTPQTSAFVLGLSASMEEEYARDPSAIDPDGINAMKTALMGPLAGIGDSLIWVLYPTIMGSIAGSLALQNNISVTLIWIALNIAFMFVRVWMMELGYTSGTKLFNMLGDKLGMLTETLSVLGLVVAGALIPTVVKITTPLAFTAGESTTEIQGILDQIFPFLLPVLATLTCYHLVKGNKVSINLLIVLIVVISMVCSAFGILG